MSMTEEQKRAYRKAYQERKREDERIRALIPSPSTLPSAPISNLVPAETQMVAPSQPVVPATVNDLPTADAFQKELALADQAEQNRMNARTRKLSSLDNAFGAEEQSLDLPFQKQETVDPFMNPLKKLSVDDLPTAEEYNEPKKNNVSMDKVDKWLDPNYQLSKEEKKEAQETAESFFSRYGLEHAPMKDIYKYAAEHPEFNEEYEKMKKLTLKATTLGNFGSGFKSAFTDVASGLADMAIGKTKDNADKYAGLVSSITGVPEEEVRNTIGNAYGQIAEKKQDIFNPIETEKENAKTQNSLAYGAGNLGGKALQYIATEPLFAGAAASAGLGKGGAFVANQVGQNAQDLALDTLPSYYEMQRQGLSDDEIGKELAKNIGINAGMNLGMGVLGEIPGLIKNAKNAKQLPQLDDAAKMQEYYNSQANPTIERQLLDELNASDRRIAEEAAALEQPKIPQDMLEQARAEQAMQRRIAEEAEAVRESRLTSDMLKQESVEAPKVEPAETPIEAPKALERTLDLDDMKMVQRYGDEFEKSLKGAKATPEFEKAYNDFWEYIVNSGNGTNTLDRAAVEEALRRTAPEGADVDGFLRSVGEQIDSDGLKFATDVEHTMKELTESEQKAIEGRTFRELTQEELERVKDGFTYNKRFVRDMEMAARGNDDLMKAVEEVKAAHNAYYDAALNGDKNFIERLSKDFNNAVGRASRKFEKEGIKGFSTSRKLASTFDDPKRVIMGAQTKSEEELARNLDILNDVDESNRYARPANEKSVALRAKNGDSTYMGTKKFSEIIGADDLPQAEKDIPNYSVTPKTDVETGTIRNGVNDLPKEGANPSDLKERSFHQSVRERGDIPDEAKARMNQSDSIERNTYQVQHNADTAARAKELYGTAKSIEEKESILKSLIKEHDPAASPFARDLVSEYSASGNYDAAERVMTDISEAMTRAGRFSQSAVLALAKDDPMTALKYMQRQLDKLNIEGAKKYKGKWKDFTLTDDELKMFQDIKPGDEEAIKAAAELVGERIGREYPSTMLEKLAELRRVSMLLNIRTNIRNLAANVPMGFMRYASDRLDAIGQHAAHLINPNFKVTNSLLGGGGKFRKLATEAWNSDKVKELVKGAPSRFGTELTGTIKDKKQVFKGTAVEKWINKFTNNGIERFNKRFFGKNGVQSLPETLRNTTYKLLDLGDSPFTREAFISRLGSYMRAQNITSVDAIPDEAIDIAFDEALKATFKDKNWMTDAVSGIKKGLNKIPVLRLGDFTLPFVQAPAGIAKRMFDYSPVGGSVGIGRIIAGAATKNEKLIRQGINDAAKGMTGTGLALLGMALYDSGLMTGAYSDNKDEKAFQKENGFKEYALRIGNQYHSLSDLQPFKQALTLGVVIKEAMKNSDEIDDSFLQEMSEKYPAVKDALNLGNAAKKAVVASVNDWFDESPLQSLEDLLGGNSYGNNEGIAGNVAKVMSSGVSSFFPSQIGAIARGTDVYQRETYDSSSPIRTFANQMQAKIPGKSKELPIQYDNWGQPVKRAENEAMAFATQNVIPWQVGIDTTTPFKQTLNDLFNATDKDARVFPSAADRTVDGRKLSNVEHSKLQKRQGEVTTDLAQTFVDSDFYNDVPNDMKVDVLDELYSVAKQVGERDAVGKEVSSTKQKIVDVYDKEGAEATVKYILDGMKIRASGMSANDTNRELLNSKGEEAVNEKASMSEALKGTGVSLDDNNMSYIREHPDSLDYIPKLAEQGITSQNAWRSYEVAKTKGYTPETFADTYKSIETNGKSGLTQGEIAAYLNLIKATAEQAQEIDEIYRRSDWDVNKKPKNDGSGWKYAK